MNPRLRVLLAAPLALASLVAGGTLPATAATDPATVKLVWNVRGPAFSQPVAVTSSRDGSGRLFIAEQTGRVRVFQPGTSTAKTYLNLTSVVNAGGERGLLGLAFSPSFTTDRYFWVAYNIASGALRVQRFQAPTVHATSVSTRTGVTILEVAHPDNSNHNGGQLAFGKDGLLYIGTGDGGGAGDPNNNAMSLRSLSGKILRVDALHFCGTKKYCIPSKNPYAKTTTNSKREIWAYGARNPWRFSFDRSTGALWVGDVGQGAQEEVDVVSATYPYAVNLRWSCNEGRLVYDSSRCSSNVAQYKPVSPTLVYNHQNVPKCGGAVIGGYVYRGPAYSYLQGLYLYGDYCFDSVYLWNGSKSAKVGSLTGVSAFGESEKGELWAVSVDRGRLYQMQASRV